MSKEGHGKRTCLEAYKKEQYLHRSIHAGCCSFLAVLCVAKASVCQEMQLCGIKQAAPVEAVSDKIEQGAQR